MRGGGRAAVLGGAAAALLVLAPVAAASSTATVAGLPSFVVDAHRGGGLEAREDSLSGLQSALDSGSAQVLDLDTRLLGDGTVVLMHDATVDRASRSTGPVSRYASSSWPGVTLDLGAWLRPAPAPEPAATLAQALDRFGGRVVLSVEAKDAASLDRIAGMLRTRGLVDSVYVNTNSPAVAQRIHGLGLHTQLWRSASQMRGDDPHAFAPYVDLLDVDSSASATDIARFVGAGVPRVWVHTVTTRAEVARARRLGADGVVVDDPRYVTGATDSYPVAPTVLTVNAAPPRVQVSDRTTATVTASPESGPAIPGAVVRASGPGLAATVTRTAGDRHTITVATAGAHAGSNPLSLSVPAGSDAERSWPAASGTLPVSLSREDLEAQQAEQVSGRTLTTVVTLRDSAARSYRGQRHETGSTRTIAGLRHARLWLTVRRAGHRVFSTRVSGADTGPAGDGVGTVRLRWHARSAGRYVVTVRQVGSTYVRTETSRTVRLR